MTKNLEENTTNTDQSVQNVVPQKNKNVIWSTLQFALIYIIYRKITLGIITLYAHGKIGLLSCYLSTNAMWIFFFYAGCLWNIDLLRPLFKDRM